MKYTILTITLLHSALVQSSGAEPTRGKTEWSAAIRSMATCGDVPSLSVHFAEQSMPVQVTWEAFLTPDCFIPSIAIDEKKLTRYTISAQNYLLGCALYEAMRGYDTPNAQLKQARVYAKDSWWISEQQEHLNCAYNADAWSVFVAKNGIEGARAVLEPLAQQEEDRTNCCLRWCATGPYTQRLNRLTKLAAQIPATR